MSERDDKRGGSGVAIGLVLLLPLLPVVYVLGFGPAVWLESHVSLSASLMRTVYAPLVFVGERCEPIGNALDWYAHFWL